MPTRAPRGSRENALTTEFSHICSLEHGTTDTKLSTETSTTPDTSAAAKTSQPRATTRTQSMDETSSKPLKAILETIREQANFALRQLQRSEEESSKHRRCKDCEYTKHFTRPVLLEAAGRCLRCKSISFQRVPEPGHGRPKSIIGDNLMKAGWSSGLGLTRGSQ